MTISRRSPACGKVLRYTWLPLIISSLVTGCITGSEGDQNAEKRSYQENQRRSPSAPAWSGSAPNRKSSSQEPSSDLNKTPMDISRRGPPLLIHAEGHKKSKWRDSWMEKDYGDPSRHSPMSSFGLQIWLSDYSDFNFYSSYEE